MLPPVREDLWRNSLRASQKLIDGEADQLITILLNWELNFGFFVRDFYKYIMKWKFVSSTVVVTRGEKKHILWKLLYKTLNKKEAVVWS